LYIVLFTKTSSSSFQNTLYTPNPPKPISVYSQQLLYFIWDMMGAQRVCSI